MSKILITGATGHLGTATIDRLQANTSADHIVAFARDINKAISLIEKGIDVRIGNFDDTESLDNALQGIDKVLLISGWEKNRLQQHKNVVDAAKRNGAKHIIYTGLALKDVTVSALRSTMEAHFQTEEYIKESGLVYTILRNGIYTDIIPMFTGDKVIETKIYLPAGDGKAPFVLRKDLGEAAANVLLQNGHENKTYHLTGRDLYSFGEIARILSEISEQTVTYTDVDEKEYPGILKLRGVSEIGILISTGTSADIKNRLYEIESDDLAKLLGRKPTEVKNTLKAIYNL